MKLYITMCYTQLLWVMCAGPDFSACVSGMRIIKGPAHDHEGMLGYIETEVEFTVTDLAKLSRLLNSYYTLTDERKADLYSLAKGLGECK